jgi:hypothetical protein
MIYYLTLSLWIVYSSLFGYCDAYYWYSANVAKYCSKNFQFKDLHPYYFWKRSIVGFIFGILMSNETYLKVLPITLCLGMTFPLFHNGFYYLTRNKITPDVYKKGFFDMSSTSIANVNFTFQIRFILFLVGLIGLNCIYLLW